MSLVGKGDIGHTICNNLNPPELMPGGADGMGYAQHTDAHDMVCGNIEKWGPGSPPPLSQIQGVATRRDVMATAAGAAWGRRCVYMDGHSGCSRRPKY